MNRFIDRAAVIIGGARGIGAASAVALAEAGCNRLSLVDLNHDGSATSAGIAAVNPSAEVRLITADQASAPDRTRAVHEAVEGFGIPFFLVHTAVFSDREPFLEAKEAGFERTIDVSLTGTALILREFLRVMAGGRAGGSVVIMSSPHADLPFPNTLAYNLTRAGMDMLIKSAATEVGCFGIRVNGIKPGWVDTPGEQKYMPLERMLQAAKATPLGRLIQPDEIARVVTFLADPINVVFQGAILDASAGLLNTAWYSRRGDGEHL